MPSSSKKAGEMFSQRESSEERRNREAQEFQQKLSEQQQKHADVLLKIPIPHPTSSDK